jgi:hypothetical protein
MRYQPHITPSFETAKDGAAEINLKAEKIKTKREPAPKRGIPEMEKAVCLPELYFR